MTAANSFTMARGTAWKFLDIPLISGEFRRIAKTRKGDEGGGCCLCREIANGRGSARLQLAQGIVRSLPKREPCHPVRSRPSQQMGARAIAAAGVLGLHGFCCCHWHGQFRKLGRRLRPAGVRRGAHRPHRRRCRHACHAGQPLAARQPARRRPARRRHDPDRGLRGLLAGLVAAFPRPFGTRRFASCFRQERQPDGDVYRVLSWT